MMEYWDVGIGLGAVSHDSNIPKPIIPKFHHSMIPIARASALSSCLVVLAFLLFACRESVPKPDSIGIAVPYELDTIDPHATTRLSDFAIASNFYDPLVTTDANAKIQPCLARTWENPDVYTWLLHLEPSVRFHNGGSMSAEDVVYTFERLLKSKDLETSTYLTDVLEVNAVDSLTVKIRTSGSQAILLNKLSNVLIVPKGSTSSSLSEKVNGTGPYKLVKWAKGEMIRMVRNEDYWGRKPALRNASYYLNLTPKQVMQSLMSGKCQLGQYNSKKFERAVRGLNRFEILQQDNFFLKYLSYDVSRDVTPYCNAHPNPFKNLLVRKAIHIGIDREQLVSELPTYAVPASQIVPAFVFGFNPEISLPAYDPTAARKLLAQAGYPNGFEVTLQERQILQETGLLIKSQLERIGILVNLKVLSDPDFFHALDTGDFTFFLSRVGATVGDASDVLESQLHSRDPARHYGVRNYIRYHNPDVDRAIEESAGILKLERRRTVLQEAVSGVMKDLPWIPLYIDQDVYALERSFQWQPRPDSYVLANEIGLRP